MKRYMMSRGLKELFFNFQGFSIFFISSGAALCLVLFRMKIVELDYEMTEMNRIIKKTKLEGKELSAKKARLLSTKGLRGMAKMHNLTRPKQEQIIVIP